MPGFITAVYPVYIALISRELKIFGGAFSSKLSQKRDVVFSYVPEGSAGYAAEQQLELVGGPGCDCRVDTGLRQPQKVRSSTIFARVFRAAEGNEVRQAVR